MLYASDKLVDAKGALQVRVNMRNMCYNIVMYVSWHLLSTSDKLAGAKGRTAEVGIGRLRHG
jgi:hypothetical protein